MFHVSVSGSKLIMFYVSLLWDVPIQPQRIKCSEVNSEILLFRKSENELRQLKLLDFSKYTLFS
jgi:hypothetical protein